MTDVLIVGAGPAGSALAIHLARMGREVVLLDRAKFPREKACGEGLMPSGVAALDRMGVRVDGFRFHGVRYLYGNRTAEGRFSDACGLGVRRFRLDEAMVHTARAAGVQVVEGVCVENVICNSGATHGVIAGGSAYRAALTVAADGSNSLLRHKLGWDASRKSRRHAVRRHYRGHVEPWVQIFLEHGQETYVTPLPNGELQIATLSEHPMELPRPLREFEPIGDPLGAAPLTVRARCRVAEGCVLLGDAAGTCDPVTGGGMAQALVSAELLASYICRGVTLPVLQEFDRARQAMLREYRWLTAGVLALAEHPALLRPALSVLGRSPRVFTHLLGMAGGRAA